MRIVAVLAGTAALAVPAAPATAKPKPKKHCAKGQKLQRGKCVKKRGGGGSPQQPVY